MKTQIHLIVALLFYTIFSQREGWKHLNKTFSRLILQEFLCFATLISLRLINDFTF